MRDAARSPVDVWVVDLRRPYAWIAAAQSCLTPAEYAYAERGAGCERRRRLVARLALRHVLGRRLGVPPVSLRFAVDCFGKPRLAMPGRRQPLAFNVSRSQDRALVALATAGELGVDVERHSGTPSLTSLVGDLQQWCRFEAQLKALGVGLQAVGPPDWHVPAAKGVAVSDLDVGAGYAAALAVRGSAVPPIRMHVLAQEDPSWR